MTTHMRSVFAAAFLAHLLLSTTCMTIVTPVQAAEPLMMTEASAMEQADGGCHHEQDQAPAQAPDSSCLHHCLSQATNRTVTDGDATELASPALPVFLVLDLPAMVSSSAPSLGTDFHPSPPPLTTVVMLQ